MYFEKIYPSKPWRNKSTLDKISKPWTWTKILQLLQQLQQLLQQLQQLLQYATKYADTNIPDDSRNVNSEIATATVNADNGEVKDVLVTRDSEQSKDVLVTRDSEQKSKIEAIDEDGSSSKSKDLNSSEPEIKPILHNSSTTEGVSKSNASTSQSLVLETLTPDPIDDVELP